MKNLLRLLIVLLCTVLFASCRTLKRNSSKQQLEQTSSQQVTVTKQEVATTTETATTKEQADKDGQTTWTLPLSNDSDAVAVVVTLPDGTTLSGRSKAVSGTGKTTEKRTTETQQQKQEQRDTKTDSTAKQKTETGWITKTVTTTRDANSFWRPVALVLLAIIILAFALRFLKPKLIS